MPIFGRTKDRQLVKHFASEVLNNILDTPVMIFKPSVVKTNVNLYGEGPDGYKRWRNGVQLYATINRGDQEWETTDFGIDSTQNITFSFLNEHIWNINTSGRGEENSFAIDIGDIVYYDSHYWEIDTVNRNEYLFGRNKNVTDTHGGDVNGIHGESLSTVAAAHLTRISRLNIEHPTKSNNVGTSGTDEEFQGLYR